MIPGDYETISRALECDRSRCDCQKRTNSHLTHCVGHPPDNNPSLSITKDARLGIKLNCKSSCSNEEVIAALTEKGLWTAGEKKDPADFQAARRKAGPERKRKAQGKRKGNANQVDTRREPDQMWDFITPEGVKVARKARWNGPGNSKTFRLQSAANAPKWGLGDDMGIEDLPLYGAELIAEARDPIVFVEGEKCADRVRAEGVLAVCLAGGAAQRDFGQALFPLQGRAVYLLADNDPEGDELMQAVGDALRDIQAKPTRLHLPVLPGEDIYDWLEADSQHSILTLLEQQFLDPFIEPIVDGLRVHVPGDEAGIRHVFQFERVEQRRRELTCELAVTMAGPDAPAFEHRQRLNVLSSSAIRDLKATLRGIFRRGETKEPWDRTVSLALQYVNDWIRSRQPAKDAMAMQVPGPITWRVQDLLQKGQAHVIFADGEAGKSMLSIHIGACCAYGLPVFGSFPAAPGPVLYIDWETDGDGGESWRRRVGRVMDGIDEDLEPAHLFYWPGDGTPLAEQIEPLRRFVQRQGITLVIIDSAVPALGGSPIETGPVQDFFHALSKLHTTTIILCHISQDDATGKKGRPSSPYGNRFWHNLPRALYRLDVRRETENADLRAMALFSTKANDWKRGGPIYVDQHFDGQPLGPITFTRQSVPWQASDERQEQARTWGERIMAALEKKPGLTMPELMEQLEGADDTIRRVMTRLEEGGRVVRQETLEGPLKWYAENAR